MKAMVWIATREIAERWTWLSLGLVLGFLPLLSPLFGVSDHDRQATMAIFLFTVLGLVSTIVLGASVMAGDLVQGRLGFLLARPISWGSIWGGKLLAAFLLAAGSILVCGPAVIAAKGLVPTLRMIADPLGALFFACWCVIGIALAQAATIAFRSRSAWLAADLAALAAAVFFGAKIVYTLGLSGGFDDSAASYTTLCGSIAVVLLAVTAAPFAFGGTSVRRAHGAVSLAACLSVLTLLASGTGWAYWASHPGASDFREVRAASASAGGHWIRVMGLARGRANGSALFFRADNDKTPRLVGSSLMNSWTLTLSADGSTAAWLHVVPGIPLRERVTFARAVESPVVARVLGVPAPEEFGSTLALSARGDRLAIPDPDRLRVYEVPSGRALSDVAMPMTLQQRQAFFRADDTVVVYGRRSTGGPIDIVQVSVASGRAEVTGHMEAATSLRVDSSGDRLLATDFGTKQIRLHDALSGAIIAPLASYGGLLSASLFTRGGDIGVLLSAGGQARLSLFSASGRELRALDLGPAGRILLDEDARGRLLAGLERKPRAFETVVIASPTLEVVEHLDGLQPLQSWPPTWPSVGSGLFQDAAHHVVRVDVETGQREIVIGPRG
jgi:hypothetical protein